MRGDEEVHSADGKTRTFKGVPNFPITLCALESIEIKTLKRTQNFLNGGSFCFIGEASASAVLKFSGGN